MQDTHNLTKWGVVANIGMAVFLLLKYFAPGALGMDDQSEVAKAHSLLNDQAISIKNKLADTVNGFKGQVKETMDRQ